MPDGTLLALERSGADVRRFFNRIFEIDFAGATDVSVGATAERTHRPDLHARGQGTAVVGRRRRRGGQNSRASASARDWPTARGSCSASSTRPNGGAGQHRGRLHRHSRTRRPTSTRDGDVDGTDFLAWQRGLGKTVGAKLAEGDADRDGDVDAADLDDLESGAAASRRPVGARPCARTDARLAMSSLTTAMLIASCADAGADSDSGES